MEKYKIAIYKPNESEIEYKDTNISDKIVKAIKKALENIDDENIEFSSPLVTEELDIRFGVIERIEGKQYLTYNIVIKPNKIK